MSRLKGQQIKDIKADNYWPKIKWVGKKKFFVITVLDTYFSDGSSFNVEISEIDLYRLINADRGTKYGFWFDAEEEQGDLDDSTYEGISYIQARYYLSVSVLKEAKRLWKRSGKTGQSWLYLKKRNKRGGRPVGGGKKKELSPAEQERLKSLYENYDRIVENCYAKDWLAEYIELERDICLYLGKKFPGKKVTTQRFTEERKKWLEKH